MTRSSELWVRKIWHNNFIRTVHNLYLWDVVKLEACQGIYGLCETYPYNRYLFHTLKICDFFVIIATTLTPLYQRSQTQILLRPALEEKLFCGPQFEEKMVLRVAVYRTRILGPNIRSNIRHPYSLLCCSNMWS